MPFAHDHVPAEGVASEALFHRTGIPRATSPIARAQALSLDVAAGAVCAASLAAWICGVAMPVAWWLALALTTWCVYSVDRLLDARRIRAAAHTDRHLFHHEHFRVLASCTAVVFAVDLVLIVFFLPRELLVPGALIGLGAGAHLAFAQRRGGSPLPKELTAATLYTAGVWFGPLIMAASVDRFMLLAASVQLVAAWVNLCLFSLFDVRADTLDGHPSLARSWGEPATRAALIASTAAGAAACLVLVVLGPQRLWPAVAVLAAVLLVPATMLRFEGYFRCGARFRTTGDLVFLLLALPALLAHAG